MAYTPIQLTEEDLFKGLPNKIGQVSLNYDYYPGKDLYSDGEIEKKILDIVENSSKSEYQGIIEATKSWPILYHLSPIRGNIIDFLPIGKEDKVLEIGSGCGAITDRLSEKAKSVTCVDLSSMRSRINANRNQKRDNIEIYVGNFNDIEPHLSDDYDYVCLIGVFEYGSSYIPTKEPYKDFLNIILKHVRKNGRVIIAIENKFGLKYWAGCTEDHNGEYFSSLEGYPKGGSARTFTRNGLEEIFKACKVDEYSFYYPYPDYKLPHTIYSDKRLPQKGELTDNIRNLDRDRMLLFNESFVYDSIISDGSFPLFSNSYLAVLGPDIDIKYAKFSNDRSPEFSIKTEITEKCVKKTPMSPEAALHLKKTYEYGQMLKRRYEGGRLKVNSSYLDEKDNSLILDFEEGVTLEYMMDELLFSKDFEGFEKLFFDFYDRVSYNSGVEITDLDLIFSNILIDKDNWTLIDYEWCSKKNIAAKEIAFRALYCYLLGNERRNCMDYKTILSKLEINDFEAEGYREREADFQKEVTGKHKSIGEIRAGIGTYAISAKKLQKEALKKILEKRIQIFFDKGQGFCEEDSYYKPDVYQDESHVSCDIEFEGNILNLRIDPADNSCLVRINELVLNGENLLNRKKLILTNGKAVDSVTFAFESMDPNIEIRLNGDLISRENCLHIDMEINSVSPDMARSIASSVKKFF